MGGFSPGTARDRPNSKLISFAETSGLKPRAGRENVGQLGGLTVAVAQAKTNGEVMLQLVGFAVLIVHVLNRL